RQSLDTSDAIAGRRDTADLLAHHLRSERLHVAPQRLGDLLWTDRELRHLISFVPSYAVNSSRASSSLRFTVPSMSSSPTRATTPPITSGSITTSRSTWRPTVRDNASASRARRCTS